MDWAINGYRCKDVRLVHKFPNHIYVCNMARKLEKSRGNNANNLDFDHPQGWARYLEVGD
jgi:hypothetical protein